jgi:hypothetical protein
MKMRWTIGTNVGIALIVQAVKNELTVCQRIR